MTIARRRTMLDPCYSGECVMRLFPAILLCFVVMIGPATSQSCDQSGPGLGQDWPTAARALWYGTGTGSRLIPDVWYRALVRADDGTTFAARSNLNRYGFRFCDATSRDPIGFVLDSDPVRAPAIGLSCAACHTGHLTDGTRQFVVHGGAAAVDLQSFTTDLFAAVLKLRSGPYQTAMQTEDWLQFSAKVLGKTATPQDVMALHQQVSDWLQARKDVQGSIHKGGDWGFGRQDAVMVALNTVAALSQGRFPGGLPAANGPVSIPSVWLTPDMQRLQWPGAVESPADIGLLGVGEAAAVLPAVSKGIGSYAEVTLPDADPFAGPGVAPVESSVRLGNLIRLQDAMADLPPPLWPKEWGVIDRTSAEYRAGEALYTEHCAACHARIDSAKPQGIADATGSAIAPPPSGGTPVVRLFNVFAVQGDAMPAVGTDPMTACNAFTHTTWGGKLLTLTDVMTAMRAYADLGPDVAKPMPFAKGSATLRLLTDLSLRILWAEMPDASAVRSSADFAAWLDRTPQADPLAKDQNQDDQAPPSRIADLDKAGKACAARLAALRLAAPDTIAPGYKAGPLAGIFASAPYLHNGSVPTLDALLSAPDARPDQFAVGAVLFDPVKVGLGPAIKEGANALYKVTDLRGRIIAGNSNEGHVYPAAALTEVQRAQLILFLKGL